MERCNRLVVPELCQLVKSWGYSSPLQKVGVHVPPVPPKMTPMFAPQCEGTLPTIAPVKPIINQCLRIMLHILAMTVLV